MIKSSPCSLGSFLLVIFLVVGLSATHPAYAQVPAMINYQGKVSVQGAAFDGTGYFKFELVDDPVSPGVNYWVNDGGSIPAGQEPTNAVALPVSNGLFSVKLGDVGLTNMTVLSSAIFVNTTAYLRVWFSTDGSTFEKLSPDRQLVSVPYALHAASADSVGGANSVTTTEIKDGTITDADISAGAAISAGKINTGSASNLVSRVIAGSGITLNPGSGVGDVTITASGGGGAGTVTNIATGAGLTGGPVTDTGTISVAAGGITSGMIADGTITNADISSSAAIAASKIAGGSGSGLDADTLDGRNSTTFASSGANSDITSLSGLSTALSVAQGGTNATTAGGARSSLGAAASGANSDITSLSALSTALSVAQGGTNATTAGGARSSLGAAASGANSDITGLSGLTALQIPSAAVPSFTADGQVALDTDNDAVKIREGSNSVGGVPANSSVSLPLIQQKDITLLQPDQIQAVSDAIPFFTVDSFNFPNGITITAIRLAISSASSLTVNVEEWTSPTDGSPTTIANLALSSATEATETTIASAAVSSGSYVFLNLVDTTAVDWAKVTIWYYVN